MNPKTPLTLLLLTTLLYGAPPLAGESRSGTPRTVYEYLAQSLVQNGTFDLDTTSWSPAPSGVSAFVWDPLDADGSSSSGSGRLTNSDPVAEQHVWATQCLVGLGVPGVEYLVSGEIYIPGGQTVSGSSRLRLAWYEGTGCFGSDFLGTVLTPYVFSSTPDAWIAAQTLGAAHPDTQNLQVRLFAKKDPANGSFDVLFDNIVVATVLIFQDGFESGLTDNWSNVAP